MSGAKGPEAIRKGGCLCGAVRFAARGQPKHVNLCHCEMCRKAGGAPVVAWATYASDAVTFARAPKWRRSSDRAERAFCPDCGSALCWREFSEPGLIDLTVGCFDEADDLRPADHLWMDSRIRWLKIDDRLPKHKEERRSPLVAE